MKYLEMKMKISPDLVEHVVDALVIAGINDAVIDNPLEIEELISNLGETEWYDRDQVSIIPGEGDSSHATITVYCSPDEEGNKRRKAIEEIVAGLNDEMIGCPHGEAVGAGGDESEIAYVTNEGKTHFDSACKEGIALTVSERDDSEWKDAWKEYYHATQVSEKFMVKPTWEKLNPELQSKDLQAKDLQVIELDPGMAFGTGTHETTSLTLKLMEKYLKPGDKVLDVGTGSGILAIAAAMLGAGSVLGIDIDEDAVRAAKENVRANFKSNTLNCIGNNEERLGEDLIVTYKEQGCAEGRKSDSLKNKELITDINIIQGDLTEGVDFKANMVVANLLSDLVIRLTESISKHLLPGGIYISSGILSEQRKRVEDYLVKNGFTIIEVLTDGDWCAIAAC